MCKLLASTVGGAAARLESPSPRVGVGVALGANFFITPILSVYSCPLRAAHHPSAFDWLIFFAHAPARLPVCMYAPCIARSFGMAACCEAQSSWHRLASRGIAIASIDALVSHNSLCLARLFVTSFLSSATLLLFRIVMLVQARNLKVRRGRRVACTLGRYDTAQRSASMQSPPVAPLYESRM